MKTTFWILLAVAVLAVGIANAAPPSGYELVWSDEFDGTSIDTSKWGYGQKPWGTTDNGVALITPEDTYISGGSLINRCRMGTFSGNGKTYNFTSGWAYSKQWLTYGYLEIRAKYPAGKGQWPAWWMLMDGWPPEFDVAEYRGSPNNYMTLAFCYASGSGKSWSTTNVSGDFTGWRTYGFEWGQGYLKWSIDGVLKKTFTGSQVPSSNMYAILSAGLDSNADASTGFPNYYEIDYFRWYQTDDVNLIGYCGDGTCGAGEGCSNCPADCGECPPPGPVPDGTYSIIARHSGKALDAAGSSQGSNVQQWTYNGGDDQRWTISHLGDDQYKIIGVQSGYVLDVSGQSTADGANVIIWPYNGGNNQKWTVAATDSGYYKLIGVQSGKVLEVANDSTADGANVQIWSYDGGNNQQWQFNFSPKNCEEVQAVGYRLTSDISGDCYVNYTDLQIIADYWLNAGCDEPNDYCDWADFEPDNDVDFVDLSMFARQWMQCNDPQDSNCPPNW